METIDIYGFLNGDHIAGNRVLVKVPKICIPHGNEQIADSAKLSFETRCSICFGTWVDVWKNRIVETPTVVESVIKIDGTACNYCGEYYKYAVPNLPGGELKCYSCRTSFVLTKLYK